MKNKEKLNKLQTAHTIVESLTAEAMEYENLLNDYAMMAEEGDTERSAWEKTWRNEFKHHVSALNEVTHLLEEFLKCEDSIDESGENSEDVVDSSEKELPEFSKQDRCCAIKIAEDFVSELEDAYWHCGGDDDTFLKDTTIVVSNLLSLLKGEGIIENSFLHRGYHGYYGDNRSQGADMELYLTGFDIGANGLVIFPDGAEANVHVVHCVYRSDDTEGFDNFSPEELVYSLCPETYDLLITSQEFENCYEECYVYLKCDNPELSEKFLDTVPVPEREDSRIAVFEIEEDYMAWSPLHQSYLSQPKGKLVYALMSEYQRFSEFEDKPSRTNIKAYTLEVLKGLFMIRLLDGERGSSELPRLNISSELCSVIDNAMNYALDIPGNKNLKFVGFLDGSKKFVEILKEESETSECQ